MSSLVTNARAPSPPLPPAAPRALSELLEAWIKRLRAAGVDYVVLRGHAGFPAVSERSDLDLVVRPQELSVLEAELELVCAAGGALLYERFHAGHLHQYYLYLPDARTFFEIDVHTCEACYGVPFLSAREALEGARNAGGLRRARPTVEALCNFLGPFLSGCALEERYLRPLAEGSVQDPAGMHRLTARLFGARESVRFLAAVAGDADELRREAPRYRAALMRRAFARRPVRSLLAFLAFGWGVRVRPWFRPRGRFLAFLGTDGAGKTAVVDAVQERLEHVFRGGLSGRWHWRPGLLPQINTLVHLGRTTYTEKDATRPHRARPSGLCGSSLRLLYYFVDYVAGYALRVLPRRRRHSLILFDRYFHDCLVDPLRSRVRPGNPLARLLARFVPRPDATFVVTAPVDVVQGRKQELPPEESARQLAAYEQLAADRERFHVLVNDGTLDEAVDRVLRVVFGGER